MTAPTASSITVAETLNLLDGRFDAVADAIENGAYALWLGSGISRDRVMGLSGVVERVLDFLQSNIDAADPDCHFRAAMYEAIELGELGPTASASIDTDSPTHTWPLLDQLASKLVPKYSSLLDIRIQGKPDDFLLWEAVDVRSTYPASASPDCEHLCIAILAIEGVVPVIASANWDGLLEAAVHELAETSEDILQIVVRDIDFRDDPARSKLLKFHGCAILAGVDEGTYRRLLIARKTQITSWMQNPDFEIMRAQLKQVATTKRALIIGLSAQDVNIQQIFADARFTMPWSWPETPPAAVFCGQNLNEGHTDLLKQVYPSTYTASQTEISDQVLIPANAKPLLTALVARVICSKLEVLARMTDTVTLTDPDWNTLLTGLRALRDTLVANAHIDYLGFVRNFAIEAGAAIYIFQRGVAAPYGRYRSLTAHPLNRLSSEPGLATSGSPELASALAVLGLGQERGLWTVGVGPTAGGSAGTLRIESLSGEAAIFFAATGPAEIQLGLSGLLDTSAPDVIVIQSTDPMPVTPRSPRGAPGRTGSVSARRAAIRDISSGATSVDRFLTNFRMAVGL